jgi:hypothetical protein
MEKPILALTCLLNKLGVICNTVKDFCSFILYVSIETPPKSRGSAAQHNPIGRFEIVDFSKQ